MKNRFPLLLSLLAMFLSGCIVDVTEQSTERRVSSGARNVKSVYFDATIFRNTFTVKGAGPDSLIADGIFSLWASSNSSAASFANNVHLNWTIDTLHNAQLSAYTDGPQKELVSIDKMSATIPSNVFLTVNASSDDVSVSGMNGDMNVGTNEGNINFTTNGRVVLNTQSGNITGSTTLGGNATSNTGNVDITLSSANFESFTITINSSGNATLHVPAGVGISFLLASHGGNISLAYDQISQTSVTAIQTNAHGGGKNITIKTATGNISVVNK